MNLTHTVGDIRNFINAWVPHLNIHSLSFSHEFARSNPQNVARPYTIGTTFPNRTLDNDTETVKAAGLANSVIVQRWL